MWGFSYVVHPSYHKVLATTCEQHHLALPALDQMNAAARVQRNGFAQE